VWTGPTRLGKETGVEIQKVLEGTRDVIELSRKVLTGEKTKTYPIDLLPKGREQKE